MNSFWRLPARACGIGLAIAMSAQVAAADPVRMGTAQQGSQNYQANTVIANTLQNAGMEVSLQSFSGSGSYLTLMNEGELDLAATPSTDAYDAITGREAFEGNALENLKVVAVLQSVPYGFLTKASSDIKTIADLKGKRIPYGYSSKPSAQNDVKAMLANGGLTIDDVETVMVPGAAQGLDALIAGRVDAAYWSLRSGKAIEADATLDGVRFLPLSSDQADVEAMREFAPTAGTMEIEPDGSQVGIPEKQSVLSFQYVLLGGADLSDDDAYAIAKELYDKAETLAAENKVMTGLDRKTFSEPVADLPFHPGAMRFYEEVGTN